MGTIEQERLIEDIIRVSVESIAFEDVGEKILPLLDRLLNTSGSLFYRCDDDGIMVPMGGSFCEVAEQYRDHYINLDPLQKGLRRDNFRLHRAASLPEWESYVKGPVYNECTHPNLIDDFYHLILQGDKFQGPNMVGIMLARTTKQSEFTESDTIHLARILPTLQTLIQRCTRLENQLGSLSFMEPALEANHPYALLFNLKGKATWASTQASSLLNVQRKGKNNSLEKLTEAVVQLGKLYQTRPSQLSPETTAMIPQDGGPPITADLRVVRTRNGEPFIFVELDAPLLSPLLRKTALAYKLSAAEIEVLKLIAQGLSDREIAAKLFITQATVRTHVGNILSKMGVRSRIQAALRVYGVIPKESPDH